MIREQIDVLSKRARAARASAFRKSFHLDARTTILDLGSENGQNICKVLEGTEINPSNVYIADIDSALIEEGHRTFGYVPILLHEGHALPFPDGFFDIVYCSSVIEHVTVPKDQAWRTWSGRRFRQAAMRRQLEFAGEICRVGKQYFVQTPNRLFPIESHSWLPGIGYLPRWALLPTLRLTNMFWVKKTTPDWNLLNRQQLARLFPEACIVPERALGMTKSLMAIRSNSLSVPTN